MRFSLALPSRALSVSLIRRMLGDALRGLGVSEDCVADILVATSEACTNVIQHSHASARYQVVAVIGDDDCALEIIDFGRGFPQPENGRAAPAVPEHEAESGRGIRIMRALVDDLGFDTDADRGTVVHLQKRLTWSDEALIRRLERELVHSGR